MSHKEHLSAFLELLDRVHVGTMTTIRSDGYPRTRWMTATTLRGERDFLYCVSMAGSRKLSDLKACDCVSWSFQSPDLKQIISIKGRAAVIDSPELKAQVLESLGRNMERFWTINPDPRKLVVIETAIEDVSQLAFGSEKKAQKGAAS
ncbi:hypothetical protein MASR2M48_05510 [Spirochaetota bacterium]